MLSGLSFMKMQSCCCFSDPAWGDVLKLLMSSLNTQKCFISLSRSRRGGRSKAAAAKDDSEEEDEDEEEEQEDEPAPKVCVELPSEEEFIR